MCLNLYLSMSVSNTLRSPLWFSFSSCFLLFLNLSSVNTFLNQRSSTHTPQPIVNFLTLMFYIRIKILSSLQIILRRTLSLITVNTTPWNTILYLTTHNNKEKETMTLTTRDIIIFYPNQVYSSTSLFRTKISLRNYKIIKIKLYDYNL